MASTIKVDKIEGSTGSTVTVPTGQSLVVTDGLGVATGGTGLTSFTAGDVLYATGSTTLTKLAKGTAEQILSMNSGATAPEWTTAAPTAGGTGQTAWATGDLLYANGSNTLTKLTKPGSTMNLQMTSAGVPSWATVSAGGTLSASQNVQSGSSVDFTGIPAGTKWITMQIENVSTNGTGFMAIQIGDAGGIETTGYLGAMGGVLNTSAHGTYSTTSWYIVDPTSASSGYSGIVHLRLKESSGNIWCINATTGATNSAAEANYTGGHKPLSAELTQVRLLTSNTFDTTFAGSASIQYGE